MKGIPEAMLSLLPSRLVKEEFERLARLKRILSKSDLTEEKALELSTKVSETLSKKYEKMM